MTRLQATIGANVFLGILAFFLIATDWREGDASIRYPDLTVAGNGRVYSILPTTTPLTPYERQQLLKNLSTVAKTPRYDTVTPLKEGQKPVIAVAGVRPTHLRPVTPVTPADVEVTLDPSGRPYDVPLAKGAKVERRRLTVLHAPSRRVAFMGGEETPYPYARDYKTITLAERPGRLYPVDAIWVHERRGPDSIVGVVIVERDTPVARWTTLREIAYGTDAGLGAITTREWLVKPEGAGGNVLARRLEKWPKDRRFFVEDVDGRPGLDTLVFQNGFGDGGFPAVAGYDASGARVAIVLWTKVAPWRLAFPQGTPPQRVTQRENALAACLAGRRTIDGAGCRLGG